MMPNVVKGSDMGGLLRYLAGPGRANEHTNPTVVAGDIVTMAVYGGRIDVSRATELAKLLDSPRQTVLRGEPVLVTNYREARAKIAEGVPRKEAFEAATRDQNVWHCSLALDPKEGQLDTAKWGEIARRFMEEMDFVDRTDGAPDVRWTAIHHGLTKNKGDHIHIAMAVVRPDGSLADVRRDHPRSQAATATIEREFGLKVLASREDRATEQATRPDERGRAERVGAPETDREALHRRVRAVATATESEAEFVRELREVGMVLRPRFAKGGTDEVVGYAIRMPAQKNQKTGSWEKAIWYGGGQLAKDLTLNSLRGWTGWDASDDARTAAVAEWSRPPTTRGGRAIGPNVMSEQDAIRQLGRWSQYMSTIPASDRDAWAKAASQTAGLFAAASVRTETKPGPLDSVSRQLARAGQLPAHRRRPQQVHGQGMRAVARMLWSMQSDAASKVALAVALTECLLAIMDMLAERDRAQAAKMLASHAHRSLTQVHMRAAGIDPTRQIVPVTEVGSPPWAAARRSLAVINREDYQAVEDEVSTSTQGWQAKRISFQGRPGTLQVDEFGHVVGENKPWSANKTARAAGPLTPPSGAGKSGPTLPKPGSAPYPGYDPYGHGRGRGRDQGPGR
ncbi:relaxase/mobilization nuclease domain-containing protein [Nocardia sp. NPDC058518]|uniref:relaxase/mobilization nuclease domain-containing protein n=1 Tax=Nocardia sp. NPDC058518 TaxID=3346534 RepID=UPI003662F153